LCAADFRGAHVSAPVTGVRWYLGIPRSGKTTLALAHLWELCARTRNPAVIIDTEGVQQLDQVEHVHTVRDVVRLAWGERRHVAFEPNGPKDLAAVLRAVRHPGRVNLLVDEAHVWLSARSHSSAPLFRLMRSHRHSQLNLLLTAQHFSGDVSQTALSCAPRLFLFRCTSQAVLDKVESELRIDPRRIAALGQYRYLEHFQGFDAT
jgi:hypothetical protein